MSIRAVFFDLGGTLLVMRRDRIFRKVLEESGRGASIERIHAAYAGLEGWWITTYSTRVLTDEQMDDAYRHLDEMVFARLFPSESPAEAFSVSKLVRKRWPELEGEIPLQLYPDVTPTLTELSQGGFFLGLISNATADTDKVVDTLGLRRYLRSVTISGAVGYSKPHPEIFRIALREASVSPSEAVHVGDVYEADIVGARNAGMTGLLIDREGVQRHPDCPSMNRLDEVLQYVR